jgi:hypothetical protein
MTRYKVSFFKNLLSSDGHPFRCLQQTIEVHACRPERAVQAAKRRYERLHRVPSWKLRADIVELEMQAERIGAPTGRRGGRSEAGILPPNSA